MTAPDQLQNVKLTLAKREPSIHDPKRTLEITGYQYIRRLFHGARKTADDDEDADPEDLEIWQVRFKDLSELLGSSNWRQEF